MPKHLKKKNIIYRLILSIVLTLMAVCLVLVFFQIAKYVPSVKEAFFLSAHPKQETFTELYFENHLSLPDKFILSKEYNFKFTIHNLENKDMEYPYEVYIDINGKKQVIDKSSVLIKNNEYKTITINFAIAIPIQRFKVVVDLIKKNQQIDFWMTEG
ncbi:MAG: hypothetical protein ACYCXQ_02830 [Candidatus Humimicrobiaceae bacterium]